MVPLEDIEGVVQAQVSEGLKDGLRMVPVCIITNAHPGYFVDAVMMEANTRKAEDVKFYELTDNAGGQKCHIAILTFPAASSAAVS